jgi:hypothetical protein
VETRIAACLIWINAAAPGFRYAGTSQPRPIADMSNWALMRIINISFISIYVAGLLWEEHRRRREAAGRPPRPYGQREPETRRLPLVHCGSALLLTGWF